MEAKDRPSFVPPFQPVVVADPAEVIALRVLVMALVAIQAAEAEQSGVGPAQVVINRLAAHCQESLLAAQFDSEVIRGRAIDHINGILGGIRFPADENQTN